MGRVFAAGVGLGVVLCFAILPVRAEAPATGNARALVHETFERDQAACRDRFDATACLDAARARQREALAGLRSREQAEAAAERQRRAQERLQTVEQRRQKIAGRTASAPASAAEPAPRSVGPESKVQPVDRGAGAARRDRAVAAARAAERASAAARRQQQIRQDEQRIESRKARRKAQAKPAVPLPAPPGASKPT